MAEYKGIVGTKIRNYTTNPDNPITGEVWYNETDQVLKFQYPNTTTSGSWRTSGSLNTGKDQTSGAGVTTSALNFSGGPPVQAITELWNGSSWTEVNDLNTARRAGAGAGASGTAALAFGGNLSAPSPNAATEITETWNGTNWTEVPLQSVFLLFLCMLS